jgi:ribose/xylose/arabinose/galactoside ABC-type transport system permease subunit
MNRKNTIYIICASAMMFVWIFITVFLTGGRDISEFTKDDKTIFSVFIILEMLTLVFLVICLSKIKKSAEQSTVNAVKTPLISVDG